MLKKVEANCKRCRKEFCRKRTAQDYCYQCRKAAWSDTKKRPLMPSCKRDTGKRPKRPFFSNKNRHLQTTPTPDLGSFVRAQIVAHQDDPNSITFVLPDGSTGRAWLASDNAGSKIIGDDRLWRINSEELLRQKERLLKAVSWLPTAKTLRRPIIVVGRNDPVKDVDDALGRVRGFQVRLCIEAEKELQVLGCGWRIVTVELDGPKVRLHHNGNTATMKRPAFKALIAANKRLRRKRPVLRLVVSNPPPVVINAEAA
jgi:hypothetical protein